CGGLEGARLRATELHCAWDDSARSPLEWAGAAGRLIGARQCQAQVPAPWLRESYVPPSSTSFSVSKRAHCDGHPVVHEIDGDRETSGDWHDASKPDSRSSLPVHGAQSAEGAGDLGAVG